MEIQNKERFIKGVESLINPMATSDLLFFQKLKRLLPPSVLKKMLHRASRNTPLFVNKFGLLRENFSPDLH